MQHNMKQGDISAIVAGKGSRQEDSLQSRSKATEGTKVRLLLQQGAYEFGVDSSRDLPG